VLEYTMTVQEHEAQRNLVALSLMLCPTGGRHQGKGHESKGADFKDERH
jgi:hypothetical protein